MSRRFGILFCAAFLGVAVLSAAPARAGFSLSVTITDLNTNASSNLGPINVGDNGSNLLYPNSNHILVGMASLNSGGGTLDLSGLNASFTDSTTSNLAAMHLSGTAAAYGTTDTFQITVTAVRTDFNAPAAPNNVTLSSSESGTFTATNGAAGESQNFQSFLDLNNGGATSGSSVQTAGLQTIAIPAITTTTSGLPDPVTATKNIGTGTYGTPYSLAMQFSITIKGNADASNPATDQFQASTTVSPMSGGQAVPEPGSVVLMLTGMPLPLVVLGMLRRRRAAA